MGVTAAVQEMLLFSKPGLIKLLPALPGKWSKGSVNGLACRGGILVDQTWDMAAGWLHARLLAKETQTVLLKAPKPIRAVKIDGQEFSRFKDRVLDAVRLEKDKEFKIEIAF
jgi:alpha-L-fucosidase 2